MINRRHILSLIASAPLALAAGTQSVMAASAPVTLRELEAEFNSRPMSARRMAQESLKHRGYYTGSIDGAWGPGTASAYQKLMASKLYKRAAAKWTWDRNIQVIDTMFFLTNDAYLD